MSGGLPKSWEETEIGNLCDLINGRAFKKTEWSETGLPIIRIQNLNKPDAIFNYFSGELDPKHKVSPGTVLFAWSGTPGTSFGAHEWKGEVGALNQHIYKIEFNEDLVNKRFFKYSINQKLNELIGSAQGAVGLRHVTKGTFTATKVAFPPLNEQTRIANKLDSLLAQVITAQTRLEKIPTLLKRYRQAVLAATTSGELTKEWREAQTTSFPRSRVGMPADSGDTEQGMNSPTERAQAHGGVGELGEDSTYYLDIEDEIKGHPKLAKMKPLSSDEIEQAKTLFNSPDWSHWELFALEQLVEAERGIPYGIVQTGDAQDIGIPTVRCGDVRPLAIRMDALKKVTPEIEEKYIRTRLKGGEVLLAIRGTVGNAAVASDELASMNANISREVAMIPVRENIDPNYIALLLQSPGGYRCLAEKVRGVAQKGINLADVKRFVTPLPCIEEQTQIVRRVESLFTLADTVEKQYLAAKQRLDRLSQSILAKAFRGELVPQDPNDEPASELLKRIQEEREKLKPVKKKAVRKKRAAS